MKKFTKIALSALSLASVAAISIAGTVAYLTNTDADINVMTLGNVKIEQHEYERVTNADGSFKTETIDEQKSYVLQDFTQGKALLPTTDPTNHGAGPWDSTTVRMSQVDSYGGMQVFSNKNAQDKFVTVENTGKTDAYVRTLVAVECGTGDADLIGTSYHNTWTKNEIGTIAVGGVNYYLIEYVYAGAKLSDGSYRHAKGVLPAGDTTYPNLSQIYIDSAATNEDMVALDGNGNGTLDVLVFSQAVQADGFDNADAALVAAFGDITTTNHPWLSGSGIDNEAETVGEILSGYVPAGEDVVIDNLIVNDQSDEATNLRALYNGASARIKGDLTITNSYLDGTYAMNVYGDGTGALIVENTALRGWTSYDGFTSASFTDCNFDINSNAECYKSIRPYSEIVLTNCDFAAGYEFRLDKMPAGASITFDNCTIGGVALTNASQLNVVLEGGTVVIK